MLSAHSGMIGFHDTSYIFRKGHIGFIAGGIAAFILMVFMHKKRTDKFAYGPYFTIAALLQLFLK